MVSPRKFTCYRSEITDQKCVKVAVRDVWCKKEVAILLAESSLMEIGRFVYYAQLPWNPFAFVDGSGRSCVEIQVKKENYYSVIKTEQTDGSMYLFKKEVKGHAGWIKWGYLNF